MTLDLEQELRAELALLGAHLTRDLPERAAAIAADMALLPVRMARGEDVTDLAAALRAESLNLGVAQATRLRVAAEHAWIGVITRVIGAALAG